jgi:glutathione S-transferase
MMITVHYLDNSRAHRILWLLEELGLEYAVKTYHRAPDMRAPESLKAVHPLGKSPVIEDGGRVVAESGAIIEYLVDTYGAGKNLKPAAGSDAALRYTYWLHYAEGSAMPLLLLKLIFLRLPGQLPFFLRPVASLIATGVQKKLVDPQLADHLAFWNAELAMSFPVEAGLTRMEAMGDVSAVRRYMEAIRARPAYQRALAKGGQYDYARS